MSNTTYLSWYPKSTEIAACYRMLMQKILFVLSEWRAQIKSGYFEKKQTILYQGCELELKKIGCFAELEKIIFLNSNLNLNKLFGIIKVKLKD